MARMRDQLGEAGEYAGGGAADTAGGAATGGATDGYVPDYRTAAERAADPNNNPLGQKGGQGEARNAELGVTGDQPVETLPTDVAMPGLPAPISAPQVSLPNTPTSIGGTFALPGSAGMSGRRTPNFAMNRGLGTDASGYEGKKKRFSAGNAISGMDSGVAPGVNPDELTRRILASLAGR